MKRLAYIDWMRGLACVLMFQTHAYDAWLSAEARQSEFFLWSQRLGTFPAPLFLFLAGVSSAMVAEKLREKGAAPAEIARKLMVRGAQIFALALLFRVQEFLLGQPRAPWTDLFRVDILNLLGLSMVAIGALSAFARTRAASIASALAMMCVIALAAPPIWTTWRMPWLPWPIESYVSGVHIFNEPQPWLFPIFPWMAFAFAGLAIGTLLAAKKKSKDNAETQSTQRNPESLPAGAKSPSTARMSLPVGLGIAGMALAVGAWLLLRVPLQIYAVYDFWHTSPNFFFIRLGLLLIILFGCYAWCAWGWGARGYRPMMELGKESLLVYWVHIQFVYGGLSVLTKDQQTVTRATAGLLIITTSMIALAYAKRKFMERKQKAL